MTVEYDQLEGTPSNLTPMPLSVVSHLKPGDEVYIWWAKDGDLRDVRVNETCTVRSAQPFKRLFSSGISLGIDDGDIEIPDRDVAADPDWNCTEWGGRGLAYFYYPPDEG